MELSPKRQKTCFKNSRTTSRESKTSLRSSNKVSRIKQIKSLRRLRSKSGPRMSNLKLLSKARTRLLSTSWMTSSMLTVTAKKKLKKTTVMVLLDTRKIHCLIMPRFNNKCKVKRSLNKQFFLLPNLTVMSFLVSPSISMLTLLVPVTSRSKQISNVR